MNLQFKFSGKASDDARARVLEQIAAKGKSAVRQMFPDEKDELKDIYILEFQGSALGKRLEKLLRESEAIEFVEKPPVRKLID